MPRSNTCPASPETRTPLAAVLSSWGCAALLLAAGSAGATPEHLSLALDGTINADASSIEFTWPKATGTRVGRISIKRRKLGETGLQSWREIDSVRGFTRIYQDDSIEPGIAYEYRISRPSEQRVETGYWVAGRELPAEENRGVALLVVDETVAGDLAGQLDRFILDLVGDGWTVHRRNVPRADDKDAIANLGAARRIRAWIQERYNDAFYLPHALILVGHVPVVESGKSAPDGHNPRDLETDLFYADTNSIWQDNGQGVLLHNSIPSDHIEMQVGRIDFARLGVELGDEMSLLKHYFDKNHRWRHAQLGDLRQAYGGNHHLFVESNALRNIVGPDNLTTGGHHDAGIRQPWLFGVDFGSASYDKYTSPPPITAVFTINFGSGKLAFNNPNNEMKALLAQPGYVLTTGWGGRPAWQLHPMALGKSIGYSHLRTVNNGALSQGGLATLEYTPTGKYPWINPIWVNLLGDPTLHPFPLAPVTDLRAVSTQGGVRLEWSKPATDAGAQIRYRIYRATDRHGPWQALNPSELHSGTRYDDRDPIAGAWYMVRAQALKTVYAGSFYTFSQGVFTSVDE